MKKLFRLTQEGVDELKQEHTGLVSQRGAVADRIKQARELGDLSELGITNFRTGACAAELRSY
jgi:transcription elongation GreA/GreB family factor